MAAPREGDIAWKRSYVKKAFGSDFAHILLILLLELVTASAKATELYVEGLRKKRSLFGLPTMRTVISL